MSTRLGGQKKTPRSSWAKDEAEMFIEGLLATSFEKLVLDEDAEIGGLSQTGETDLV